MDQCFNSIDIIVGILKPNEISDEHIFEFEFRIIVECYNKDAEPDGISNIFLKKCAISLRDPITHIISKLATFLQLKNWHTFAKS